MKFMKGKKVNNEGSAMVVAIVVSMVVMAFCLSLLLVAYSLFNSTVKTNKIEQCKEVVETFSLAVDKMLTEPVYTDLNDMKDSLQDSENNLWMYLRYNLGQESWPDYINDETDGHDMKAACRYFNLNLSGEAEGFNSYADNISTCIYWEKVFYMDEDLDESDNSEDSEEQLYEELVKVHIRITCKIDDLIYDVENVYDLTITHDDMDINEDEDNTELINYVRNGNSVVNPSGNQINENDRWVYTFDERK